MNPTHRAYGITSRSQLLDANKMIAVVMQMQPTKIQMSARSHSGWSSGVKQTCGRLYRVMQVHIRPSLVSPKTIIRKYVQFFLLMHKKMHTQHYLKANRMLPPTSVTIQSGIARLTIANISAARNSVALIVVNLSMVLFGFDAIRSNPEFAQQLYLFWLFFIY